MLACPLEDRVFFHLEIGLSLPPSTNGQTQSQNVSGRDIRVDATMSFILTTKLPSRTAVNHSWKTYAPGKAHSSLSASTSSSLSSFRRSALVVVRACFPFFMVDVWSKKFADKFLNSQRYVGDASVTCLDLTYNSPFREWLAPIGTLSIVPGPGRPVFARNAPRVRGSRCRTSVISGRRK